LMTAASHRYCIDMHRCQFASALVTFRHPVRSC
jgi:hypothetical protein